MIPTIWSPHVLLPSQNFTTLDPVGVRRPRARHDNRLFSAPREPIACATQRRPGLPGRRGTLAARTTLVVEL